MIDGVIGMYCLERLGIHHTFKEEILAVTRAVPGDGSLARYSVTDYLGWDPAKREPHSGQPDFCKVCEMPNRKVCLAVIVTHTRMCCGVAAWCVLTTLSGRALSNVGTVALRPSLS